MKRIAIALLMLVVVLGSIAIFRALMLSNPSQPAPVTPIAVDGNTVAQHLGQAVQFQTVSYGNGIREADKDAQLDALRAWMEKTYPAFHKAATREVVGESLLFTWTGQNPALPPVLLMAHMDVVPVVAGTEGDWTHAPFGGDIDGGYVWGRGTIDDKGSLVCLLEAAERLAAAGFRPPRTILFSFGQDEEVGGRQGNAAIAALLASRGVHLQSVLDEGAAIMNEPLPGVRHPVAFVAVGEKGYLSLRLTAHGEGGHSSLPSGNLAIGRAAAAVTAVLRDPYPFQMDAVKREQLAILAPYTPFRQRLLLGNLWLTAPLIERSLSQRPDGAAALHTTMAPTMMAAGVKDNVIPPTATVTINCRLQPGDTIAAVTEHVRRAIADSNVDVEALPETQSEASKLADTRGPAYHYLARILAASFAVPVAPEVMSGATDSRHYLPIADTVLRVDPYHFEPADLKRIHGTNERLAVSDLGPAVGFYVRFMQGLP